MTESTDPTSPMNMGSWALGAFGVCAFLAALFTLLESLRRARDLSIAKLVVGVIGGFLVKWVIMAAGQA